ncbi:alpha-1-antitrypsin homolog [Hippocampus comes]|uniref:Serpin domain-containing protein n=1 Tax=Hippocampus comes TaxID=109280 RepID=A0A3Q3DMT3_HIPCM|nr:PREDICTED: alpha-1-antitrypsin homolog [Hippocampus comes]XP_019713584.1 PREDICTED: alpha-1-antitrypsin homolog [Hippocampus comes]XP_019713585.1 PREDICTED: alpha-1-antitrypsin homolog [Hippocampus comes]
MHGFFASCTVAALLLATCLAIPHHHHHQGDHADCHVLSSPNADFGFALYKNLRAKAGAAENIFFSPLGISTALSLMSTGAHGETHSQMFSTLGYSGQEQAKINDAYKHLFEMLAHHDQDHHQQLDVSNAVAIDDGFSPSDAFMKNAKEFYSAEVLKVDFGKSQEAAAEINSYIANKTHNMIKEHVKDLDEDMAMMLINTVYFKGEWFQPFNKSLTGKADFHVDETTKVEVDMMKRTGRYDMYYDNDNGTIILLLPYKSNTSMMIVLPDEGKMKDVEGFINKDYIEHWHNSVYRQSVDVFLPKFSISAKAALDSTLKEMGITAAFGDTADFSGISDDVKLKLSKASHEAVLNVDETGTEAAAVTTLEVMPMSMPMRIKMDRPFLVLIVEDSTKSVLFMGKIANPTAK